MSSFSPAFFQAYEKRFPTCKMIPVFLGSDIISEYKSDDGAEHTVERRCRLAVDAPYLLKKVGGISRSSGIQSILICWGRVINLH